jgi:hypothetical protein
MADGLNANGESLHSGDILMITFTLTSTPHQGRQRYIQVRHPMRIRAVHDTAAVLRLMDLNQASDLLSVSPGWLLAEACLGRVPHYRLCGELARFEPGELQRWIQQQKVLRISGWES